MNQPRWARRCFICVLCLGFVLSYSAYMGREALGDERPTDPDIGPHTFEFLPYQASDYRFQIIPPGAVPPEQEDFLTQMPFDDTDFPTGSAAFGSGGDCPLQDTVQTGWPVTSQLLVRRVVDIPAEATSVRILVAVGNDIVGVFFNGTRLVERTLGTQIVAHAECPMLDEFRFDVPPALVQPGPNLIAFHVVDRSPIEERPNESFFDARILAELPSDEGLPELGEVTQTFTDLAATPPSPDEVTAPAVDLGTAFPPGGPEVPPGPPTLVDAHFWDQPHDESTPIPGEPAAAPPE
jgi:hypothetical protein